MDNISETFTVKQIDKRAKEMVDRLEETYPHWDVLDYDWAIRTHREIGFQGNFHVDGYCSLIVSVKLEDKEQGEITKTWDIEDYL